MLPRVLMLSMLLLILIGDSTPAWSDTSDEGTSLTEQLDAAFGSVVKALILVIFADFRTGVPLVVAVLLGGGIYYSFYFRWLPLRAFRHAVDVVRGRYDDPDDPGEISHFQALSSALSATIGLGNIAGVAVAFGLGGPGALLWMMVLGIFGVCALQIGACLQV